ncbi:hypothetical protein RHMOL_Rhmol02G0254500 [Rhododendron molle]|uniref:Uncharacterized protein n=1 Tax=Rhododendron molle TaxID=49168 RepID=A0ACC0PU52_RHOML|nr:hypothetical protein RHMOL_Rhmol02G0254500 [Rhododendron molle]
MSLSLNHRHPPPQISLSISHYLSPSLIVHLSSMAAIFNRSVRVLLSLRLEWPYVTPVQQDDGPNLAVPIAYKDEFSETMATTELFRRRRWLLVHLSLFTFSGLVLSLFVYVCV